MALGSIDFGSYRVENPLSSGYPWSGRAHVR
jgi:hypothetical protein